MANQEMAKSHSYQAAHDHTHSRILKRRVALELDEHKIPIEELCDKFGSSPITGLTEEQAEENIRRYGRNISSPPSEPHPFSRFCRHNFEGLACIAWNAIIVCWATYLVEAFANITQPPDIENVYLGVSLTCFILINGSVSYWTEWRGSKLLKSIKFQVNHFAVVIRNGVRTRIDVKNIAMGDLIEIKAGDRVPADVRVTKASNFKVDNSGLTGLTEPAEIGPILSDENPFLTKNLIFSSTFALEGSCQGIVFNIGDKTVVGHIPKATPVFNQLQTILSKSIIRMILIFSMVGMCFSLAFCIFYLQSSRTWLTTTLVFVGVYVACVPEQLLMAARISFRLAAARMEKCNCLVKHFHAIETLAQISYICTDKTGFLTENTMNVNHVGVSLTVHGVEGDESFDDKVKASGAFKALIRCITLCGKAECEIKHEKSDSHRMDRTKTESLHFGLMQFTQKHSNEEELADWTGDTVVHETQFNAVKKYSFGIHRVKNHSRQLAVMMGSAEVVLRHCSSFVLGDKRYPLTHSVRKDINEMCEEIGSFGEMILGFADQFLETEYTETERIHKHIFRFLGLVSLFSPIRPTIPATLAKCKSASIKIIMITRDHPSTAEAIAIKAGVFTEDSHHSQRIVTGEQLHIMALVDLDELIRSTDEIVFAQTTPHQKLLIVKSCQRLGGKVAVTGEDVKDCPALKTADIAIATNSGLDIVRLTCDVVLLDNSLAAIVSGIEEGRLVYSNMEKCIMYILTSSIPQLVPFFLYMFLHIPRPLGAFSVLLISIATNLIPVLALTYEKLEYDLMRRIPRNLKTNVLLEGKVMRRAYLQIGVIETLAGLLAYFMVLADNGFTSFSDLINLSAEWDHPNVNQLVDSFGQEWTHNQRKDLEYSCHSAFCFAVILTQIANVITCRFRYASVFQKGMKNWLMNIGIVCTLAFGLFFSLLPTGHLEKALRHRSLIPSWFLPSIPFALFIFIYEEVRRYLIRKYPNGFLNEEFGY